MSIDETLAARQNHHGDFSENAYIAQSLKYILHSRKNWRELDYIHRESLDIICTKIGRILAGDPSFADHWHDIAGYALLVEKMCPASSAWAEQFVAGA